MMWYSNHGDPLFLSNDDSVGCWHSSNSCDEDNNSTTSNDDTIMHFTAPKDDKSGKDDNDDVCIGAHNNFV
jgi:hypothetical protein